MNSPVCGKPTPSVHEKTWQLIRALPMRASARPDTDVTLRDGALELAFGGATLRVDTETGAFSSPEPLPEETAQMLALCLPLCVGPARQALVFAHLGQSLDGQIATASGASRYVTSTENLIHMHRLRALADAVIVGAGTVERDDPKLTTRLVPGDNPVRVVIDPSLRLSPDRQIFQDGEAPTLVVCRAGAPKPSHWEGLAEIVEVASATAELAPADIVRALHERGLRRLFVEGGGVTVSHFLGARALHRLHVTICPLFIGRGRPGVVLPGIDRMDEALRPRVSRFLLGQDVLFDCAFDASNEAACGG